MPILKLDPQPVVPDCQDLLQPSAHFQQCVVIFELIEDAFKSPCLNN